MAPFSKKTARIFSKFIAGLLSKADIKIGGERPWDIRICDERFYGCVLRHGSLGLGEAYTDGWWDASLLDEFFYRILKADLPNGFLFKAIFIPRLLGAFFINYQERTKAFEVGKKHYDIGNDLYQIMLDDTMTYSCGYWKNAHSLKEAQEAKLDLVCKKIGLKKGDRVLDIGGGWGSFACFAAQNYGASVVAITISQSQAELARKICKNLPIEIRLQDYRDIRETFSHIVSIGMVEHVGYKNYRRFMQIVSRSLENNGFFLLHTIGSHKSEYVTDPWIEKYIFPNSMIPSIGQIGKAIEGLFVMEDWHNFGADYDKTLMAWFENFNSGWPKIKEKYGQRFYRMWKYYLLSCAGMFRARKSSVWQIVLSKKGVPGGYKRLN